MGTQQTILPHKGHRSISLSTVLLFLALLVAVLAIWPVISQPGLLNTRGGGDSPFLLQRLGQLETALREGHFPVRWMPDANYGFGYPFFNFYAPLSIYVAAAFRFLGLSIVRSLELAQLAGFLLAAWGIFLLAQRWLNSAWAAFLASVAYTVAPFHLVNIYVRGDSLAEFWAMAFYPWILLAADSLLNDQGAKFPYGRVAAFALAYAALILSHNISALIFTPFLLLFLLLWALARARSSSTAEQTRPNKQRWRIWLAMLIALLLGLALSAWFFIPALAEQDLAQLGPVTEGFFHYSNHFRGLDLVQPSLFFDYSVAGGKAFRLGLLQAIMTLSGTLALIYATFRKRLIAPAVALFILLSLLVATFMITPLSRFLWDNLPLLSFTQFPWRFLSVQAFAAALAISALALLPVRRWLVPLTAVILIAGSLVGLRTDHLLLADEDITPQRLAEYEWFTANIGSTVSAEYLPPTVQPRMYTSAWLNDGRREDLRALSGELLYAQQTSRETAHQTWRVATAESGATLLFPTMYWPGWQAEIDGAPLELGPAPGSGLIMIDLPPGQSTVELQLHRTSVRHFAEYLSLAALLLLLYFLLKGRKRPVFTVSAILPLAFFLVCLFFILLWPQKPLSAGNLTWDYAQMAYLHHDQAGVPFDSGAVLHHYEYQRESVSAGENLVITLALAAAEGKKVTIALGTPAVARPGSTPDPPLIAEQTQIVEGDNIRFDFLLAENVPAGLIIPRLTIDGAHPLTPSGRTRGDIYLRPVRVVNGQPSLPSALKLDVQVENVQQEDPESLLVQLAWIARRQLTHNYNVSLRLLDQEGSWYANLDRQPGYGFLPSSGWPLGTEVNDWLAMPLPQDLPDDIPLFLVLRLYEVESGEAVLSRRLGEIVIQEGQLTFTENEPSFAAPEGLAQLPATFGETIQLRGYQVDQAGTDLRLTLYWETLAANQPDYTRFVHLFDPKTEMVAAQNDGQPLNNSYPTSQWLAGEIVADTILFDLSDMPAGSYQIGVGFYRQEGDSLLHLAAVNSETQTPYSGNRAVLPDEIVK